MEFEEFGAWFIEKRGPAEIVPDFFVTGEIVRRESREQTEPHLLVERRDGSVAPDPFSEEQALTVRTDSGLVVFIGCAHRGLLDSVAAARTRRRRSVCGPSSGARTSAPLHRSGSSERSTLWRASNRSLPRWDTVRVPKPRPGSLQSWASASSH
jgi:hypothetical protein